MFRGRDRTVWLAALFAASAALFPAAATPARPATKFVSKRYGYSIVFPGRRSRWAARFAVEDWSSDSIGGIGAPGVDTFTDGVTGRNYLVAARATESTLDQWAAFVVSARSPLCGTPRPRADAILAGAPGRVFSWSCSDGYRAIAIAGLVAGRGYLMLAASPTPLSMASDARAFDAARRSFRLLSS